MVEEKHHTVYVLIESFWLVAEEQIVGREREEVGNHGAIESFGF